jgi:ribosomal protein L7/L12
LTSVAIILIPRPRDTTFFTAIRLPVRWPAGHISLRLPAPFAIVDAMPQCTRCKKTVATDAARCPHCGAWLSQPADAPEPNHESLEDEIRSLLRQGRKIEAISLYREQVGVGLAAAKDAVERIGRGDSPSGNEVASNDSDRPILELLAAGRKIAAIKLYREQTSCGLKEAKDAVEALAAQHGIVSPARSGCLGVVAVMLSVVSLLLIGILSWR